MGELNLGYRSSSASLNCETRSQNQSGCRSDLKSRPNATLYVSPLYSVDICKTATSKKQEWHGKTGTGPAGLLTSRASHHPGGGLEPTRERQRDWEGLMSYGRRGGCWSQLGRGCDSVISL